MVRKRKLQRIQEVGNEVEASIVEQGEASKLETYANEHLFTIDKAGTTAKISKREKDPSIWSSKFDPSKAKGMLHTMVKKIRANPMVRSKVCFLRVNQVWSLYSDWLANRQKWKAFGGVMG
jgi:hypothetical protein